MSTTEGIAAGYGGYEYQIVVTVWVALDLVIARACCDAVEVEPASQEDIAADLRVPPEAANAVETVVDADGPVEIQIKRRSRFWSVAEFRDLVETPPKRGPRGPAPRERALGRLQADPRLRYVLITDAEVHPDLKSLVIEEVGRASGATDASFTWLSAGVAARIGVREKRVPELVEREIDYLLEHAARVPFQKVPACREALVERVRERLLGRRAARLGSDELEALITANGGFPPSAGDDFVPPASFDDLRRRLNEPPFALVLVGPPGIGKTRAAQQLVDEHRHADRPFDIVTDPAPHEIRAALARAGRTLFYLEDPWGRYKLAEDAATWNDELPRLIREARANSDKRFLVTSRTGLLRESIDRSTQGSELESLRRKLGARIVPIGEADFDAPARCRILRLWMRGAKRWQRDWVEDRLTDVVSKLTVPHALSAFAHSVKSTQSSEELRLGQLLAESQVAAIGDVMKQQVRQLDELVAGVTLWAFLSVREPLTDTIVQELALWLGEEDLHGANLPRLIEHLTANGWLKARDGVLTAHPTVIEGLEHLVDEEPTSGPRALRALFGMLVRRGRLDVATRLLNGLSGRNLPIPATVHAAIEQHLREVVLTGEDSQLLSALASLARVSTAKDPMLLLVRALSSSMNRKRRGIDDWSPPAWTVAERAAVSGSSDAERLARRYIKAALGRRPSLLREERLVDFLWSLGWDLSEDFTSTAIEALEHGGGVHALHGALAAPAPAWDRLLDAAFADYDAVERWFDEEGVEDQRRAEEGELDASHSAHVIDEPSERFYSSTSAFAKIVAARRTREGYGWLVNHPRRATLVSPWAAAIPYDRGETVSEELRGLLATAESSSRPDVWQAIGRSRCFSLVPLLLDRLARGSIDELTAVWGALFGMYEPEDLAALIAPALAPGGWERRAAIVFAARKARVPDRPGHVHREANAHQRRVSNLLAPVERGALDACFDAATHDEPSSGLDGDVLDAVTTVADGPHELLAAAACLVLAYHGRSAQSAMRRLLLSNDKWVRLLTLRAIGETQPLDRAALRRALTDSYYQCRRYAMFALSEDASAEERAAVIEMASDASAPVREACSRIIGLCQWRDGVATLCALLKDQRDLNEGSFVDNATPEYHVAREAARALGRVPPPLPPSHFASLLELLQGGRRACSDVVVHYKLLAVVGRQRDRELAPLILELLRSPWRMGGENGTFPLRYAAAWSWVDHLLQFGDDAPLLTPDILVEAAEHTDGRLAAPALLALGIAWKHAPDGLRQVFANPELVDERYLLTEVGARVAGESLPESMTAPCLLPSHPGRRLIALCWETVETDDAWRARFEADADVQRWIETIRTSSPVNAAFRASLLQSPRKHLLTMISSSDFRDDELTTGTSVLSSFNLAGLE